jgi:hypothetical protein
MKFAQDQNRFTLSAIATIVAQYRDRWNRRGRRQELCDPMRCGKTTFIHVDVLLPQLPKHDGRLSQKRANRLSGKPKLGTVNFSTARLLLVCVSIFSVLIAMPCSSRSQTPAGDVAAQVRSQGYGCDEPVTAKRDVRLSKPDLAVWVLNCRNATYRVRLHPNMAAHVIKVKRYH